VFVIIDFIIYKWTEILSTWLCSGAFCLQAHECEQETPICKHSIEIPTQLNDTNFYKLKGTLKTQWKTRE